MILQLDAYRAELEAALVPVIGKQPETIFSAPGAQPIGHHVVGYGARRSVVLVTMGFARREQRHAHGETPKRVELIAEPPRASLHVAKTLAALGSWMQAADRPISVRFKAFEPLRVEQPLFDLSHFLIVPGGDASLPTGERIALLRVIPIVEDEYAHVKMRGDGAARAWWHQHRGDRTLPKRWAPALKHDGSTR